MSSPATNDLDFGVPTDSSEVKVSVPLATSGTSHRVSRRRAVRRARQRRRAAVARSATRLRTGSPVLLAFLVVLALTLMLIDLRSAGSAFSGVRATATSVLGPLQSSVRAVAMPATGDLGQLESLQAEVAAVAGDRARLAELEALFGLVSRIDQEVVAGSVTALNASPGRSLTATIDVGTDDGIAVDQAVIAGGGLVGRIITVGTSSSVVRLLGDPEFVGGGRLASSGEAGIVRGSGDPNLLPMEILNPLASPAVGDQVVTFGSPNSNPFPPGLALGEVIDVGDLQDPRRTLLLRPTASLTSLSIVGVLTGPTEAP